MAQSEALLQRARDAAGGKAWDKVATIVYEGSDNASGMEGQSHLTEDVRKGRRRQELEYGIFRLVEVWDGGQHWRQDMTGGVHLLNSGFAMQANRTDEWMARRAYLKPGAEHAAMGPVEHREDAGKSFDVVRAVPVNGQPIELWFDKESGLLTRSVRKMPITVETVTYSDYRTVEGVRLPFRIATSEGPGHDPDTLTVARYMVNTAIGEKVFQPPTAPLDTTVAGGRATVPIEVDGYLTLEVRLNGKGPYAFLFDTGGHAILTPEAAKALDLHPTGAGSSGGVGSDRLPVQYAKVDRMEMGGVSLKDQTFLVIPLQYNTVERGERPPLAGILGVELLERMAARIDYRRQTMTFWPSESYRHEGPGIAAPITFADDIPLVPASLNGKTGDFALDTGNGASLVVQHVWAEQNGLADGMKHGVEMVSFGSGGSSTNWASRVADFELGGSTFHHIVARYVEDKAGSFSSWTEAGNIGTDVLANFTVDFDYAHNRIWFEPVPGYTPLPFPRSGMTLYKQNASSLMVANTMPGGPAAVAGIRQGDTIVSIGGKSAKAMSARDYRRAVAQAPGTKVAVVYSREGKEETTTVELKELLP